MLNLAMGSAFALTNTIQYFCIDTKKMMMGDVIVVAIIMVLLILSVIFQTTLNIILFYRTSAKISALEIASGSPPKVQKSENRKVLHNVETEVLSLLTPEPTRTKQLLSLFKEPRPSLRNLTYILEELAEKKIIKRHPYIGEGKLPGRTYQWSRRY